jgi:hypothetical protein
MKKLFSILAFLSIALIATAQDYAFSVGGLGGTVTGATGSGATGRKTAAYSYVFEIKNPGPWFYQWSVRLLQTHPSNNTATIAFYGALENSSGAYKQIGSTISWKGTTTDTCAVVSSTGATAANALNWHFIKVVITPTDTAWVEHIRFNLLPANPFPESIIPGR